MNFADPFKQLVERRLWPVALLLVAALVAVPFLLSEPAEDSPLPPSTGALASGPGTTESLVSVGDPASRDDVRAVLGARKDPFRPAQMNRIQPPDDGLTNEGVETTVDGGSAAGGGTDAGSGSGSGAGDTPVADPVAPSEPVTDPTVQPTVAPTVEPVETYDLYSLQVRFGLVEGELATREVKRLTGLPGGTNPAALYLGLTESRKAAVFLVDAGTEVVGDGECDPSPANCQTLVLEQGETVFLTREGKQWQLDLVDIRISKTTDAAEARRSRTAVAPGGRRALKAFNGMGGYRYSKASGTVRRIARPARGLSSRSPKPAGGSKLVSAG